MNPSQLDESLLTAYLDDELSEKERQLVEEQLKVNEHWKQLLAELQSIQSLIRELPTPVLARSLADGPWTKTALPNAVLGTSEVQTDLAKHRSIPKSVLALAAGLILCAVGSFAWIRFGKQPDQIAKLEQMAAVGNSPKSPTTAVVAKPEAMNELMIDASTPKAQKEVEQSVDQLSAPRSELSEMLAASESDSQERGMEPAIPKLKITPPLPAALAEMSDRAGLAFSATAEPSVDLIAASSIARPEPVDTLFAVHSRTVRRSGLDRMTDERTAKDKKNDIMKNEDYIHPTASEARVFYFEEPKSQQLESLALLNVAPQQRHELRALRSDLPTIIQRLRELGWEVQSDAILLENESIVSSLVRELDQASSDQDNVPAMRPPTLTGAIIEPTDWIRIVLEGR